MTTVRDLPWMARALGELTVIVVGVLIALWVDNWNQDRLDTAGSEVYLSGLLTDVVADSADLLDRRITAEKSLHAADQLIRLYEHASLSAEADSIAEWILYTAFIDNFQSQDHTYREILGGGGLRLIPDADLRRQTSAYYRSLESADFFTDYYKKEETDFWDLLEIRLHPDDFRAVSRVDRGGLSPARVLDALRSDPTLVNAIQMNRHWTDLRRDVNERRIDGNARLAEALRDRLAS